MMKSPKNKPRYAALKKTSGRKSSRLTLPSVALSIRFAPSMDTRPLTSHCLTVIGLTPNALAKAALVPNNLIALFNPSISASINPLFIFVNNMCKQIVALRCKQVV